MDSIDTAHVPPPDPENFLRLERGFPHDFDLEGKMRLVIMAIEPKRAQAMLLVAHYPPMTDWLNLDRPCVALRMQSGEPYLTLTYRGMEDEHTALIQASSPLHLIGTRAIN